MKHGNLNLWLAGLLMTAFFLGGCVKGDFDEPPINIPTVDFQANTTIAQLKAMYNGKLDSIRDDIIIKGVVVANDESGNLYKQLIIQDETGGIVLGLDKSYLYTEYKLGQRVYIKCRGMYLGDYNKLIQLGYPYNGSIGRLPEARIPNHIFRDSLPGKVPAPITLSLAQNNSAYISMLVRVENVKFLEVGVPFAPQGVSATNRTLADLSGNQLVVRTSSYANFASLLTPSGFGTVQGILSIYQTTYQLTIRDTSDIIGFSGSTPPPPSSDFPYPPSGLTPLTSLEENFDNVINQTDITLEGWTNEALKGNRKWQGKTYQSEKYAQATSYNSSDASNVTWLITPPIVYNSDLKLSFKSAMAYYKHDGLTVWILTNYAGNPETATWTQINATLANAASGDNKWVPSGDIPLANYVPSGYTGNIYIGFRYEGTQTQTTTYRVDEIKINSTGGGGGGGGGSVNPVSEIHENFDGVSNDVDIAIEGWLNLAEEGTRLWRGKIYNTDKYAQATSYKTTDNQNVIWLITPPVKYEGGKVLTFKSAKAYWVHNGFSVFISSDFNGTNLNTATWTPVNCRIAQQSDPDHAWIDSGNVLVSDYVPQGFNGNFYVAFKYVGNATNTTTFRLDEVNISPVK